MVIKTFIIGTVLVGITIILTELHRKELERELELERAYDPIALERLLKVDDDAR